MCKYGTENACLTKTHTRAHTHRPQSLYTLIHVYFPSFPAAQVEVLTAALRATTMDSHLEDAFLEPRDSQGGHHYDNPFGVHQMPLIGHHSDMEVRGWNGVTPIEKLSVGLSCLICDLILVSV